MDEWPRCTWEWDDGSVCGELADAVRFRWLPEKRAWYYCPRHLAVIRRMTPDEIAWHDFQVATYPVALR